MSKGVKEPGQAAFESETENTGARQSLKVRRIGNSLGVILPKDVLSQLNVQDGDELDYAATGERTVELRNLEDEADRLMKAAERIMEQNKSVLRALAK